MNLKVAVAMEEKKNEQSSLKFYILPNYSFCVKAFAICIAKIWVPCTKDK